MISHLFFVLKFYKKMMGPKLIPLVLFVFAGVGLEGIGINFALPILLGLEHENKVNIFLSDVFATAGIAYNLVNVLILLNIIVFMRCIFMLLQNRYIAKMTADMQFELRDKLMSGIFDMEYQNFLKYSSGYLNNVVAVEVLSAVSSFAKFSGLLVHGLFAIAYASIALLYDPYLFMLCLSGLLLVPILKVLNSKTKDYSMQTTRHSGYLQKFIIESLRHFKYLKATGTSPKILKHIRSESSILCRLSFKLEVLSAITQYAFEPLVFVFLSGIIAYYVGYQRMNIIELSIPLFMIYRTIGYSLALQGNLRKFFGSWGSIDIIDKVSCQIESMKENKLPPKSGLEIPFDQPIVMENVSFSFKDSQPILQEINLKIEPRSMVAFVGDSGSGKSTIVNLIIGLLDPTEGTMAFGQTPYSKIDRENLRASIGYIIQEDTIFHDNIYNNIVMWGDPDRSRKEEVQDAARKAHIDKFIESLCGEYESIVGEGGINISGGQRQRLCIAREIFKDPEILIFDEATSSLDSNTEKEIQCNIDEFKGRKTIILVAHRMSTIRNANNIYVLKNGRIVEHGSYDMLCGLGGEFSKLANAQK